MAQRQPIVTDEWYHCFNRGVDKRKVFRHRADYERFLSLLLLCNSDSAPRKNSNRVDMDSVLRDGRANLGSRLVDIGAYALMPNHVHFVIRQVCDDGLARFMQRVFTGYTMYFNQATERTGALFSGSYKSKHLNTDAYLKQATAYVLLNPVELFVPGWKQGNGVPEQARMHLLQYRYSSVPDWYGDTPRSLGAIVGEELRGYYEKVPSLHKLVSDSFEYYTEFPKL